MIAFALCCALMLLVALAVIAWPLLKPVTENRTSNVSVLVLTGLSIGALSIAMYLGNTNWSWSESHKVAASNNDHALDALRQKTEASPDDVNAWLELGKAYASVDNFAQAVQAFQKAYDLSKGKNIDAVTGLAEVLVMADQSSMSGRVPLLIDEALQLQPMNPKALWYGGMVALQLQNLPLARQRFQSLLSLSPPQNVRSLLERQIQDLDEQLGDASAVSSDAVNRSVQVHVTLAPAIKQQLQQPVSLFVLARNPQQPGAPLAVERHGSNELPLQVELSTDDAMLPTRTLKDAAEVEIVARLSASGSPTEQAGDYFGSARYSFAKQGEQGSVSIEINQRVK